MHFVLSEYFFFNFGLANTPTSIDSVQFLNPANVPQLILSGCSCINAVLQATYSFAYSTTPGFEGTIEAAYLYLALGTMTGTSVNGTCMAMPKDFETRFTTEFHSPVFNMTVETAPLVCLLQSNFLDLLYYFLGAAQIRQSWIFRFSLRSCGR